jgi:NADH:ubiquinone oxidoreductase subunit 6 (subunit J)
MMSAAWIILGLVTLAGAVGAMSLRNLVHGLLCLMLSLLGLAGLYLALSATFVALTQVLVYLGAVSILIVFAILLTRGGATLPSSLTGTTSWTAGIGTAMLVLGGLAGVVIWGPVNPAEAASEATVRAIGERLMTAYVLPLEAMALLLTGALIGAVILAMPERTSVVAHPGSEEGSAIVQIHPAGKGTDERGGDA